MWIWGKTTGKMFNWSSLATGPKTVFLLEPELLFAVQAMGDYSSQS